MKPTITVEKKTVYGNELICPLNFQQELYILTGTKTLTARHIRALRSMGFEFMVKVPELV